LKLPEAMINTDRIVAIRMKKRPAGKRGAKNLSFAAGTNKLKFDEV